jgi:hypothetical protein
MVKENAASNGAVLARSLHGLAEKPLRQKSIFASAIKLICPVQPSREKYSASVVGQISGLNPRVSPE